MQTLLSKLAAQFALSERYRLAVLRNHAVFAVIIGPLFAVAGNSLTPQSRIALGLLPGFPASMGAALTLAGLLMLVGAYRHKRWATITGLALMMSWYATFGAGLSVTAIHWALAGGEYPPPTAVYASFVYLHVANTLRIHLSRVMTRQDAP